jgi:hypothetical protein
MNYFETNNRQLTRSKITDYLKCPRYFFQRHIEGSIAQEEKDCFVTGKLVDELLTDSPMDNLYFIGSKATKEGKQALAEGKTVITQVKWDSDFGMALAVSQTSAMKELVGFNSQVVISTPIIGGEHFDKLCGLPDWLWISDDQKEAVIADLKTSADIDTKKYYYHCKSYAYFLQQAVYQYILEKMYPGIICTSYHLVVGKEKNIWPVKTFLLDPEEIELEKSRIPSYIEMIANDKTFSKADASLNKPILLNDPYGNKED